MTSKDLQRVSVNSAFSDRERAAAINSSRQQYMVAEVEVEAEAEAVGNTGKQMVMAGKRRQQQWQMDGDSGDSLEQIASEEVHVGAIEDGRMSGRRCWWTCGVALVRLWDSAHGSTRNKWKKECRRLYYIKGADYGRGSGLKAGLCKLNRQERWRQLQERTEMMRSAFLETLRLNSNQCNCKGNLTNLRRKLHLSLAKGNPN
jgi:hypothetical protein